MTIVAGRTTAASYVVNVPGQPDYDIKPLLTVGDEVPLLQGNFGNYTPSSDETFAFTGIPDGTGVVEIGNYYYIFVNHELRPSDSTDISTTVNGQINGSRVSLFLFNKDWKVVGGKNLIETVEADGTTYSLDLETGNYLSPSGEILNADIYDPGNFGRFCSGFLATNGFVDDQGNPMPIWFAPEENGTPGRGWAVSADGKALALDGLGRYSKEQVLAASEYRATNSQCTVLISTEDTADGEIS